MTPASLDAPILGWTDCMDGDQVQTALAQLMELPAPRTVAELLERMPPARAALLTVVRGLTPVRLSMPGPEGWAAKDHLAHLALWERMIVAHLSDRSDHTVAGMTVREYAGADLETLNARLHALSREWTADAAMAELHAARAAIEELLRGLGDSDLLRPYWDDDPSGRIVADKIAGDTYRHDIEHRGWIMAVLGAGGAQ